MLYLGVSFADATLYGNIDQTYNTTKTTSGATVTNQQTNISAYQMGQSFLGVKGEEDLGGGLSAFFTLESALTPNNQQAFSSSTNTANRQTFAGLKKNGIGQFALGTQYTTIHNAVAATDPGNQNNMLF